MGFFAHAQTVDTRPLFPPSTWLGYEATSYVEDSTGCFVTIRVLEELGFDSEPLDWLPFVFKKLCPHNSTVLDIFGLNGMEMSI